MSPSLDKTLLDVQGLKTHFPFGGRWFGKRGVVRAVDGIDLQVRRGEIVALVGESGSGKTTVGRSVLRLIEPTEGSIEFDGTDLRSLPSDKMRPFRRRMQIIFQDPYGSLSPRMQIEQIIAEPLRLHRVVQDHEVGERVVELLTRVGLEPYFRYRYPHEMSGGQRQRIAIARALSLEPEFIVCDEPVSALDVSVQASILNILLKLQRDAGIALLFISHDLAVVERVADRVIVMYKGKIVEEADTERLIKHPLHPYTQALISAVPGSGRERIRLRGDVHAESQVNHGCPFAPRCPEVEEICRSTPPPLESKGPGQLASCHLRKLTLRK